ncbi:MAG: radical SAM family heme chaperone HemW [Clostridia bacterium]|nr:radical SAM family heme chaperone HemW [Clostridia bacterium]
MDKRLGIYIHIPFCASKCGYCDFYSLAGCDSLMPKYQDALCAHIRESVPAISKYYVDSVYFGGGTPSYFGAKRLCAIFEELRNTGRVLKESEVTVEVNPDSAKIRELRMLRKEGFNRLSLGVQSANNDILKLIGRRHNWKQVETAVKNARDAGFDNISLDLIYGLPSQTKADWSDTLAKAMELRPEHISCYGLKLEEGTPMYQYKDSPFLPDDDEQADMYLYAVELLSHYGYAQYEISNFSIRGYESKHNLKYWRLEDYMGFGAGAHSYIDGLRYSFIKDIEKYIAGVSGQADIVDECDQVSALEHASEYIMMSMRTVRGLSAGEYHKLYRSDFAPIEKLLDDFVKNGWAVREEDSWHFTSSGFLLSNVLIGALLEAQSGNRVAVNPWMREAFDAEEKTELPPGEDEVFRDSIGKRIKR